MTNYSSSKIANHLAKRFGWKVFPVKPDTKSPFVFGWQQKASNEPGAISSLFQPFPQAMVGVLTGPPNMLTVFDIDTKNGVNGFKTLEALGVKMSTGAIARTPSGGAHFYHFSGLRKFKSTAGKIGPGLDVRCNGGCIIAPGSVSSVGEYTWLDDIEPEPNKIGALSDDLISLLEKADKEAKNKSQRNAGPSPSVLDPVSEGSRNSTMASRCGYLFSKGYSPEDVLQMMERINQQCCHPPLDNRELSGIYNSIRKREGV